MNRNLLILLCLLVILLCWLGIRNLQKIEKQNMIYYAWQQDTARYIQQRAVHDLTVQNLKPGEDWILPRETDLPSAFAGPYLNAAQGVEVHLEGIRWMGKWFDSDHKNGIDKLGGMAEVQINQILFDPDFEEAGMPDLNVELTAPRFFRMKNFLSDWLDGFQLTGSLGKAFGENKPVVTHELETLPGKRQQMSLWLLEFDTFLRIEPSPTHENINAGGLAKHPVSGISTDKLRRDHESRNQRYGNVSILLKFTPKEGTWYLAGRDETGMLVPDGSPMIGIGAVECIGIKAISENEKLNNIGVYLRRGSSLALYDSPEAIDNHFIRKGMKLEDALVQVEEARTFNGSLINRDLFGRDKYAILHLANLGSWQEGSWLSSVNRYADQYHARFVIHAYVLGEWTVKPIHIAQPEPRPPFELKQSGVLDFLLPDLNLGFLGRLFSGVGWIVIGGILLVIFFPPAGMLVGRIFG